VATFTRVIDDITKAKARANKTFIVQASLMIVTHNHQNIIIVQATVFGGLLFIVKWQFFLSTKISPILIE
jgi:hypothetical protein